MPNWLTVLIALAVGLVAAGGALTIVWKTIRAVFHFIATVEGLAPVIVEIAKEFKANAGSTLKDKLDHLELSLTAANDAASAARSVSSIAHAATQEHTKSLNEITQCLMEANDQRREINGQISLLMSDREERHAMSNRLNVLVLENFALRQGIPVDEIPVDKLYPTKEKEGSGPVKTS